MSQMSLPSGLSVDVSAGIPLLAPKLYVPRARPDFVPRPRLLDQLDQGLTGRFVLVSGPAGYGKTTLVSQWLASRQYPVAWISLDAGDNDPVRFLRYVVGALQIITPEVGQVAQSLLRTPQLPPIEFVLTVLINELCGHQNTDDPTDPTCILVLDDYHLINAQPVHHVVTFLVDNMPPQTHLIIATRADPPLPLSRWRSRDQMTEIRTDDLRFNTGEVATFLDQVMRLDLSTEDVVLLETRTEGWPAGLQMAALSLPGRADASAFIRAFSASHRHVLDYLVEEVLSHQSEAIQTFLLQTSILERLTGSLCDAVTGQTGSQAMLERLERANLFLIPLDDERRWYRYHHLFAELLRARLLHSGADSLSSLHSRAIEWYDVNRMPEDAIRHALRMQDYERAAYLVERVVRSRQYMDKLSSLLGWIDQMPVDLVRSRPVLCLGKTLALIDNALVDEADDLLAIAEGAFQRADLTPEDRDVLGSVYAARSAVAEVREDASQIIESAQRARELLSADHPLTILVALKLGSANFLMGDVKNADQVWADAVRMAKVLGDHHLLLRSLNSLALSKRQQGKLAEAAVIYRQALETVAQQNVPAYWVTRTLKIEHGDLLYEWNDLETAKDQIQAALSGALSVGDPHSLSLGHAYLVRVLLALGDLEGALIACRQAEQVLQKHALYPDVNAIIRLCRARLCREQGDLAEALHVLEACEAENFCRHGLLKEWIAIAKARLLILLGHSSDATDLLTQLHGAARAASHGRNLVEITALQALALEAQGRIDRALGTLEECLGGAEPEGYVRAFLDEGVPMVRLLRSGLKRGAWSEHRLVAYVNRLLAAFERGQRTVPEREPSVLVSSTSLLIEPLSGRELEILQLMASGLSNQEIAEQLYLALGTVKAHLHNIYGKLGVQGRTQAIARARELKLL